MACWTPGLLINAVLCQDSQTKVTIDEKSSPRFRYGSGKWGKALFKVTLESSLSSRSFSAYALPDPSEAKEEWFQDYMLVPVLIGMDFIRNNGLVTDFHDGYCAFAATENPVPFYLPKNGKNHYMVDIVDYLTLGRRSAGGHPTILWLRGEDAGAPREPKGVDAKRVQFANPLFVAVEEGDEVRPLTSTEQSMFEFSGDGAHEWKELRDMLPQRNYVDLEHEAPEADEREEPELPGMPSEETVIPPRIRFQSKMPIRADGYPQLPEGALPRLNDYGTPTTIVPDLEGDETTDGHGLGSSS